MKQIKTSIIINIFILFILFINFGYCSNITKHQIIFSNYTNNQFKIKTFIDQNCITNTTKLTITYSFPKHDPEINNINILFQNRFNNSWYIGKHNNLTLEQSKARSFILKRKGIITITNFKFKQLFNINWYIKSTFQHNNNIITVFRHLHE